MLGTLLQLEPLAMKDCLSGRADELRSKQDRLLVITRAAHRADRVGFEPTDGYPSLDFESSAFNRSAICPVGRLNLADYLIDWQVA